MTKERLRRYRSLKSEEQYVLDKRAGAEAGNCTKLQEFYRARLNELAAELLAIEQAISALPEKERAVLRDYYIDGLSWEDVSDKNHYSVSHVHRLHANALIALRNGADRDD